MIWTITFYLTIGVLCIAFFIFITGIYSYYADKRKTEDDLLKFLKDHPQVASLAFRENGKTIVDFNPEQRMPLASVVKIIVAIEYARQVTKRTVDPEEKVSLDTLGQYYIPSTDGGAHPAWLEELQQHNKVINNTVSLHEVARGMMKFSSNANTEYLFKVLSIEQINQTLSKLPVQNHETIYPISSAILIPTYLRMTEKLSSKELEDRMTGMSMDQFRDLAQVIHMKMEMPEGNQLIEKMDFKVDCSRNIQKNWSKRLVGSTTRDYITLLSHINQGTFFDQKTVELIRGLMVVENPRLKQVGAKGGSSICIQNIAFYHLDKENNYREVCFFLDLENGHWVKEKQHSFLKRIIEDKEFRERAAEELNKFPIKQSV